jgi:Methyltransferase domain
LKKLIKSIPFIGTAAGRLARLPVVAKVRRLAFPGSAAYWKSRYLEGETSGSGSYGRLAEFKAEILNELVRANGIHTIFELGCGDGAQLELARYPEYVGVDVASGSVDLCSGRFAGDATKRFYLASEMPDDLGTFDLVLSLDVIYHLIEDSVFETYMQLLFARSHRYIAIYSSDYDAAAEALHVRHRKFTAWIAQHAPEWRSIGTMPNRYPFDPKRPNDTSFSDFHFLARREDR